MSIGNFFTGIKKANKGANYKPRIPPGQNTVVLKKYGPRPTSKEDSAAGDTLLESSWMIASCTDKECKEGDTRDWPWFIKAPSWGGVFARRNAQEALEAIMKSVDLSEFPKNEAGHLINPTNGQVMLDYEQDPPVPKSEHDVASIGELASYGYFRGIQLGCSVEPSYNKKEKKFNVDKDGKPYYDANWKPIPGQTLALIAEMRAGLDEIDPPEIPTDKVFGQQPQTKNMGGYSVPQTQAAPAQTTQAAPATQASTAQATQAAPAKMSPALQAMLDKAKKK